MILCLSNRFFHGFRPFRLLPDRYHVFRPFAGGFFAFFLHALPPWVVDPLRGVGCSLSTLFAL